MPVPTRNAQSLERGGRQTGGHLKNSTKVFQPPQPVSWVHWGPNINAFMKKKKTKQIARGIKKRSERYVYAYRAVILLASQRYVGTAPMTGVLE